MTRSGEFRVDLFHRLDVARIHLPPLRERPDDIRILFNYFLQKSFRKAGLIGPEVSDEALVWLKRYSWTGNVRELENLAEKVLVEGKNGPRGYHLPEEAIAELPFQFDHVIAEQHGGLATEDKEVA